MDTSSRRGSLDGGPAEPGTPAKRAKKTAEQIELEKLRRQNKKLAADLKKTRMALDIMGKAHALLEELSESTENDDRRRHPSPAFTELRTADIPVKNRVR